MIRIIGGEHRSRKLHVLDRQGLRPTPDRVRETLFNWLAADIHGARVLDLFAGSGALGFEALSRGAAWCDFVEKDAAAASMIQSNIELLRLNHCAKVMRQDALVVLKHTPAQPYDVVFLDPPYASELLVQSVLPLSQPGWLAADAKIFIEHSTLGDPPALLESNERAWKKHRQGTAGEVSYSLYQAAS